MFSSTRRFKVVDSIPKRKRRHTHADVGVDAHADAYTHTHTHADVGVDAHAEDTHRR